MFSAGLAPELPYNGARACPSLRHLFTLRQPSSTTRWKSRRSRLHGHRRGLLLKDVSGAGVPARRAFAADGGIRLVCGGGGPGVVYGPTRWLGRRKRLGGGIS